MSTTIPDLDPAYVIEPDDVIMITHSDGTTEKIDGIDFIKSGTVNTITANEDRPVSSDAVNSFLEVKSADITLVDNTMSKIGKLRKSGNLVNLSCRIYKEAEITVTANQVLATIPAGFRPAAACYIDLQVFDAYQSHQLIAVNPNGDITTVLQQTYSRLDIYLQAGWCTS
ncbi:MAG: hypothetical protein J6S67_12305 [Methanobrevibacter sp.]|nr:hypothetical protein [Methanobrevibacter sp.]